MNYQNHLAKVNYTSKNRLFESTSANPAMDVDDFFVSK